MKSRQAFYAMASCFLFSAVFFVGCGGGSSQSASVQSVVKFSTHPNTSANEGDLYTYTPTATDTANGTISFAIAQAPDGATLSGDSLAWTPTSAQSRLANSFTITATSTAGGSAQQTWSLTPTGVIHGQQIVTWHKSDGTTVSIPNDLTQVPISAVVATANGFTTISGAGATDGTFTVARVPGGAYFLLFYDEVFSLSKSSVDLSFDRSGRPDVAVATSLTRHYQMGNLDPWQISDDITLYSRDLDTIVWQLGETLNPADTSMDVSTGYSGNMLDASKGDTALLTQMVANNFGGIYIKLLSKMYSVNGVTETDGGTTLIGGPTQVFTDVPTNTMSMEANVKGASFAGMRPLINPIGVAFGTGFYIDVLPYGSSKGWFGAAPDLVAYFGKPLPDDEDLGPLPFGNPFDPNWPLALAFIDLTRVTYNVPGVGPVDKDGRMAVYSTTLPAPGGDPIAPITAPVGAPTVDSHDFFADQIVNDLTPTISWTAPSMGAVSEYIVQICKWQTAVGSYYGCGQYATQVARVHTKATSVKIPPGILESGSSYFLTITSRVQTGVDLESAPYASAFPYGEAQALSGVISVVASASAQSRVQSRAVSPRLRERIIPPEVNARFHHI